MHGNRRILKSFGCGREAAAHRQFFWQGTKQLFPSISFSIVLCHFAPNIRGKPGHKAQY
jgi:hypothetical protein